VVKSGREVGEACRRHGGHQKLIHNFIRENRKGIDLLGDLEVDGRMELERESINWIHLAQTRRSVGILLTH
jgi:hypothetical protein